MLSLCKNTDFSATLHKFNLPDHFESTVVYTIRTILEYEEYKFE